MTSWPSTVHRRKRPWSSTSETPDARSTCRAGAAPTNETSTLCTLSCPAITIEARGPLRGPNRWNYRICAEPSSQPGAVVIPQERYSDSSHTDYMASYAVNHRAIVHARGLIDARQYVLDSDWADVQPRADDENAFLKAHTWNEYAEWHLGLNEDATDETKSRYAFVYGDFRRVHRSGLIACQYRAAEWRHKEIELAAHELLQRLDKTSA